MVRKFAMRLATRQVCFLGCTPNPVRSCTGFAAQGKAELAMRLRERFGGSGMGPGQSRQSFGKGTTGAIGAVTKETANFEVQANDFAVPRQVGQSSRIATGYALGRLTTLGAPRGPMIS